MKVLLSIFASSVLLGCGSSNSGSGENCVDDICYRLTFHEVWNAGNFPTEYPVNSHFSPLIGAVHGPAVDFFELNQSASSGIESMAETGNTTLLRGAIEDAVNAVTALNVILGDGISNANTSASVVFGVTDAFPMVTLVSMVAPSPDWFIGIDSLNLKDVNDNFYDNLTINLEVYDAGTDQGVSFASTNSNDNSVITKLSCVDLMNHCGFTNGVGTDGVQFIGRFEFKKL